MSDDDKVIRPAAFTERPSAESEIARRAAEIYDEFKDRRDDMMVERIAQRVVELLREDLHSLLASHQVDMDASGTRARGGTEA